YSRCLSRCLGPRKKLAVTAFAEALNFCFKDGLNATRDYRALAGLFPVLRVATSSIRKVLDSFAGYAMHVCQCKFLTWSLFCGGYIVKYLWINQPGSPTKTLAMTFMIFSLLPHVMVLSWAGYRLTGHIKRTLTRHSHRFNLLNCRTNGYQEVKLTATTFTRLYIPLKLSGYTLMDKNILLVLYVTCAFYFHA
ncbi:hypothetical protein GBAR_LOCUS12102, partial [Geodia barretti]